MYIYIIHIYIYSYLYIYIYIPLSLYIQSQWTNNGSFSVGNSSQIGPGSEKELRIRRRRVRFAAKGSPNCKNKINTKYKCFGGEVITHAWRPEARRIYIWYQFFTLLYHIHIYIYTYIIYIHIIIFIYIYISSSLSIYPKTMNKQWEFFKRKFEPNRSRERRMIEKELRIRRRRVRFAAKVSPNCKNKINTKYKCSGGRWSHTLGGLKARRIAIWYCAEQVWLAAVTAQQSRMIKNNSIVILLSQTYNFLGVKETTPQIDQIHQNQCFCLCKCDYQILLSFFFCE